MRPALGIAFLVVVLIGCIAASRLYAHPASCGRKGCGCAYLGLSPKDSRVKTDQRKEIILDWLVQDGMVEGLEVKKIWAKGSRFGRLAFTGDVADALKVEAVQKVVEGLRAAAAQAPFALKDQIRRAYSRPSARRA
ncbi:MAG: hypothetical protein ACYS9X_25565, partial [Planctomycetota bacterium]